MKQNILVVDDEPDVLAVLRKKLEGEGYAVTTAEDGIKALELIRRQPADLVLLDVMMPGKDGFTVLKEMQADQSLRGIPVIMVTAKGENNAIFEGQALGATDYIVKPIDLTQLLTFIRRYL